MGRSPHWKYNYRNRTWDPVSHWKSRQRQRVDPDLRYLCFVNHKTGFCSLKTPRISCDKTRVLILTSLWANSCSHTDYLTNIIGHDQNMAYCLNYPDGMTSWELPAFIVLFTILGHHCTIYIHFTGGTKKKRKIFFTFFINQSSCA